MIPAFNEASRIKLDFFSELLENRDIHICFVNDGSTDQTGKLLEDFAIDHPRVILVHNHQNLGKAESIRSGFHNALQSNFSAIGFLDADTPFALKDVIQCVYLLKGFHLPPPYDQKKYDGIFAARVKLLGRDINRTPHRHLIGRGIATLLGLKFEDGPYDFQSGLKLFSNTPQLEKSMARPFKTRWFMDFELLSRFKSLGTFDFWEEPVTSWDEVPGSKIKFNQYFLIIKELIYVLSHSEKVE